MANQLEIFFQRRIIKFLWHQWMIVLMESSNAYDGQYNMVMHVTNKFTQTNILPNKYGEERIIMKIIGVLVDMLLKLDNKTFCKYIVFENVYKLIYVIVLKSIYEILVGFLLIYNIFFPRLVKDLI